MHAIWGSISRKLAAGGTRDDIKTELASHAQQLSAGLFSGYTQSQEGPDGGTRSLEEGTLLRWGSPMFMAFPLNYEMSPVSPARQSHAREQRLTFVYALRESIMGSAAPSTNALCSAGGLRRGTLKAE